MPCPLYCKLPEGKGKIFFDYFSISKVNSRQVLNTNLLNKWKNLYIMDENVHSGDINRLNEIINNEWMNDMNDNK